VEVPGVPRIVTQYDTVTQLDTAWITRVRKDTIRVNVIERVTVTVPETLRVLPPRVDGITALSVGRRVGDSTLVHGFTLAPLDTGVSRRTWTVQAYTAGPLRGLVLDSLPRFSFYPVPKRPCNLGCVAKYVGIGVLAGFGVASVVR
jgi:hypothetical protein